VIFLILISDKSRQTAGFIFSAESIADYFLAGLVLYLIFKTKPSPLHGST